VGRVLLRLLAGEELGQVAVRERHRPRTVPAHGGRDGPGATIGDHRTGLHDQPSRPGRPTLEPWYRAAEITLEAPLKLWFNWRFEGLENIPADGPALLACNHTSYFDPLAHALGVVNAHRRPRFLAKVELYDGWFMGHLLRGARQIPVDRGSGSRAPIEAAVQALHEGQAVIIFPEGTVTTNPDHTPMRGKTGVARIALEADVPVIPSVVWGAHQVIQKGGQKGITFGRPIWGKVGAPMDFSDYRDQRNDAEALRTVTDEVMAELSRLVADLRSRYPKRWEDR
jgi:1-acyl-sn-glycerol-3-phosphate acyltransferase